ncbi:MAG: alginate export family protein [Nitrospira sp.]|nr:alginate export family protein [Nitrospira sp.]
MVIEPFYVLYSNRYGSADNAGQGLWYRETLQPDPAYDRKPDRSAQGRFDFSNEIAYQFGQMGQAGACVGEQKCLHINAWATRNWIGYTFYDTAWKTRIAFNLDYASGDSRNNTCTNAATCNRLGRLLENFFLTNHPYGIHGCRASGRTCYRRRSPAGSSFGA